MTRGNEVGEVKIWQALVDGQMRVGTIAGEFFQFFDENNRPNWIKAYGAVRLTELELHEAGTGVWIEGVSVEKLSAYLREGYRATDANEMYSDYSMKWNDEINRILAQLSPQPEATEEQVSLGECNGPHGVEEECPKHGADIKRRRYGSPSPAKVGIELSELENFSYLRGWLDHNQAGVMGDYGSPWFHFCVSLARQLFADYTPPTPPPVELPEPKEPELYGTTVLRGGYAFQKNHVFSHYGIPPKEWFRSGSGTPNSWDDIKDGAEVIYSPSHVIGSAE